MDSNELQRACVSTLKAGSRSIGRSIEAASMLLGRKAGFDGLALRGQRREAPGSEPDVADCSLARQAQAQLEAIRGVACCEILRSLTERRLVKIAGRAEELGRPILYATTKQFLETFGLPSLKDLPEVDQASPWERFRDAEADGEAEREAEAGIDEPDDGDAVAEVDKAGAAGQ